MHQLLLDDQYIQFLKVNAPLWTLSTSLANNKLIRPSHMKQIVGGAIEDFLITKCNMFVNLYEDVLNLDALYHCYLSDFFGSIKLFEICNSY